MRPLPCFPSVIVLTALLCLTGYATIAQHQLVRTQSIDEIRNLNQSLQIWSETDPNGTFDQLQSRADFQPYQADIEMEDGVPVWGNIRFFNPTPTAQQWVFFIGANTHAEVWVQSEDIWLCKKSGKLYPVSDIEIAEGLPWNCKVLLDLPPQQEVEVFLRIRNTQHRSPVFDLRLQDTYQWSVQAQRRNLIQGIFHGMTLIMLLYNLLVFGFSRDKTYLYYAFYILVAGLYLFHWHGYSRLILFPEYPEWDQLLALLSSLSIPAYLIFMRSMVNSAALIPRHDPWIKRLIIAGFFIFGGSLAFYHISQNSPTTFQTVNLLILIQMGMIFTFLSALYRTKDKLAYFFVLGTSALWIFSCTGLVLYISVQSPFAIELIQMGVSAELLLFSVGLGYRMKLNEQKRLEAQQSLIHQLRENERIQSQAKEELEVKVRERTSQLEAEKEKALKASRVKAEFLSTMSHEIRTPINGVIGMTNILLGEAPREDQLENLNVLKFSAENLMVLINDILDFSKIEAGKIDFESINFHLPRLLKSIQQGNHYQAAEQGIEIRLKVDDLCPQWLKGDPTRLGQVLNNLVSNAVKFTPKGTVTIQVSLVAHQAENLRLLFEVIDTGIGIDVKNQHKIFQKFTQEQSSTTREYGGTGLGLAISRKLLQLQGSEICLKSVKGKGSTFYFEMAYFQGEDIEVNPLEITEAGKNAFSLQGLHALIVEDNRINALIARKFFNSWGVQTQHAENGKIALDMLQQQRFDFIMMDLQMPVMDGFEATRAIRNLPDPVLRDIPIIALTASAMLEVQDDVFAVGMDGWAIKPFIPEELYQKIGNVLRIKQVR